MGGDDDRSKITSSSVESDYPGTGHESDEQVRQSETDRDTWRQ